jgi:hypothetical protein
VTLAGTLATTNGGTGLTSFTANGVVYASSTSALATGSALTFNGTTALSITGAGSDGNGSGPAFGISSSTTSDQYYMRLNASKQLTFYGYDQSNSAYGWVSLGLADGAKWAFYAAGSEQMRLTSTGLGIGTSSPSFKLGVTGSGNNATSGAIQTVNSNAGTGTQTGLWASNGTQSAQFSLAGTGYTAYGAYAAGNAVIYNDQAITLMADNASTGVIKFAAGGNTERMRIDSSGNLLLGATSDAIGGNKLLVQSASSANNYRTASIYNTGASSTTAFNNRILELSSLGSGADVTIQFTDQTAYNSYIGMGSGALYFATNGTTERMRIDSSGNVGIGTTSPNTSLVVQGAQINIDTNVYINQVIRSTAAYNASPRSGLSFAVQYNSGGAYVYGASIQGYKANSTDGDFGCGLIFTTQINGSAPAQAMTLTNGGDILIGTNSGIFFSGAGSYNTGIFGRSGNAMAFNTGSGSEAMRINSSGNLLVGTTNSTQGGVSVFSAFSSDLTFKYGISVATTQTTGTGYMMQFVFSGTQVGSIATNAVLTAYNTSSDYRLKNTIAPMTGALAKVALLKPRTYKWNVDGSNGEGFIAHELAEVVPQCVTGEKDAVDANGNPKYQGIDVSFLVATLTAAIQELSAKVTALEAKLGV